VLSAPGLEASVPLGVARVTGPAVAPLGTVAFRRVSVMAVKLAGVPLNETDKIKLPHVRLFAARPD
jgi:hypothetical protein